jgi:hypothetical protein
MTLVAALSGREGLVMFADTQETVSGYSKKTIDKMEVWDFQSRPFRFAIAGACTDATYVDALLYELSNTLMCLDICDLRGDIVPALAKTLTNFYSQHIWPRPGERPQIEYLIGIQPLPAGYPEVLHISETAVNVVGTTTHTKSIGVGCYLADYIVDHILGGGEAIPDLCAAAVYVAKEVEHNIDGVGEIDRAVILDRWGGYDELTPSDIEQIGSNIGGFNEAMNYLFLLSSDVSRDEAELPSSIIEIAKSIRTQQLEWYKEFETRVQQRASFISHFSARVAMKRNA